MPRTGPASWDGRCRRRCKIRPDLSNLVAGIIEQDAMDAAMHDVGWLDMMGLTVWQRDDV
jgi:hypothetical protein